MMDQNKKKKFLDLPRYGGGKEEFNKFIAANLRYPKAAMEAKIEGKVLVEYEIDDNGIVHNPRVLRSLGYGCDEEALRLVSMLRFKKVKNRGVRVRVKTKTDIHFKLPQTLISYSVTPETRKENDKAANTTETPVVYEYIIKY